MKQTLILILHWVLNVVLISAAICCWVLVFFGNQPGLTLGPRIGFALTGVSFGVLAFFFVRKTITSG